MALSAPKSCQVILIMDPHFGNAIENIVKLMPVWIIDSPVNRSAVEHVRKYNPNHYLLSLLLYFSDENVIETFRRALNAIEDHHGSSSQVLAYESLRVIGIPLEPAISIVLNNYGFSQIAVETDGFIAKK